MASIVLGSKFLLLDVPRFLISIEGRTLFTISTPLLAGGVARSLSVDTDALRLRASSRSVCIRGVVALTTGGGSMSESSSLELDSSSLSESEERESFNCWFRI